MTRPDRDPRAEQPSRPSPDGERREFLVQLGKMTFLTAAIVKLGVSPHAQIDVENGKRELDALCGKKLPGEGGGVRSDLDCGKEKSNGDQDCGLAAPGVEAGVWTDSDCAVSGGEGADNDCGKQSSQGWTWGDNDCAKGGEDQDCGKANSLWEPHGDSDGS